MAYTPKTWVTGETIDAVELNDIETSLVDLHARVFDVRDYGAATTNSAAANKTAIDLALAAAAATGGDDNLGGGMVFFPPGEWLTTGGHTIPVNVHVIGAGLGATMLNHTTATVCFTHTSPEYIHRQRAGIRDLRIANSDQLGLGGVRIYDCYGFNIKNAGIFDYRVGYGLLLENVAYWTEGTYLADCALYNNLAGIVFKRASGAASASFGYTKFHNFSVSAGIANAVGIDMGSTGSTGGLLYNSEINGNIWVTANNVTALRVRSGFIARKNNWHLRGEQAGSLTGCKGLHIEGTMSGFGIALIDSATDTITGTNELIGFQSTFGSTYDRFRLKTGAVILDGIGNPESVITAPMGSLYLNTLGGASTTLYVKTSGSGNTGWTAK